MQLDLSETVDTQYIHNNECCDERKPEEEEDRRLALFVFQLSFQSININGNKQRLLPLGISDIEDHIRHKRVLMRCHSLIC